MSELFVPIAPRIEFAVPGTAVPSPRPRAQLRGRHVHIYTPDKELKPWKQLVALYSRPHRPASPWNGPVRVTIDAYFARNAEAMRAKYPREAMPFDVKPDFDNLAKPIVDVMTEEGFWFDDGRVFSCTVTKWYSAAGSRPGIVVSAELVGGGVPHKPGKRAMAGVVIDA